MKIITDDAAYVQYNDLAMLHQSDELIPINIFMNVYGKGKFVVDDRNRYAFMKFDDPQDIEFFKGVSWFLNYFDVKDMNNEDIIALVNSMESKFKSGDFLRSRGEELNHLYCSIGDFYMFKNGDLNFELPEGVEYPYEFYSSIIEGEGYVVEEVKHVDGIKAFFKHLFGGKK